RYLYAVRPSASFAAAMGSTIPATAVSNAPGSTTMETDASDTPADLRKMGTPRFSAASTVPGWEELRSAGGCAAGRKYISVAHRHSFPVARSYQEVTAVDVGRPTVSGGKPCLGWT